MIHVSYPQRVRPKKVSRQSSHIYLLIHSKQAYLNTYVTSLCATSSLRMRIYVPTSLSLFADIRRLSSTVEFRDELTTLWSGARYPY